MAYACKFFNKFKNYYDELIRVEILKKDYVGAETEVKTAEGDSVIISYPGDDADLFRPIMGSECTINLVSMVNFQFIELHSSNARQYRVDIYKDGNLFWRGWILPDLFSEPYEAAPYIVSITARCGLGELEQHQVPATVTAQFMGALNGLDTTRPNLYSIIANALQKLEIDLSIYEAVNIYQSGETPTNDDSPLFTTYQDLTDFEGMTYYECLSNILKCFGARLYQQDGAWQIVRIRELQTTLLQRHYGLYSEVYSTVNTKLTTFQIGRPVASQILAGGATMKINPAWKQFTLSHLKLKESFLLNGDFTSWQDHGFVGNGRTSTRPLDYLNNWIYNNAETYKVIKDDKFCVWFRSKNTSLPGTKYIEQTVTPGLEFNLNQALKLFIEFGFTGTTAGSFAFEIKLSGLPFDYYLKVNTDETVEWTVTPTYVKIENVDATDLPSLQLQKYEQIIPEIPEDCTLSVKIYAGVQLGGVGAAANLIVSRFELQLIRLEAGEEIDYPDPEEITTIVSAGNIYTPDTIELIGGDAPNFRNSHHIYNGNYKTSTGARTILWKERAQIAELPLLSHLANDYQNKFLLPQWVLTLPILSQNIKFDSCIVDYQINSKKYLCCSADINLRTNIFTGTYIEFATWEGAPWILADGTWNDNGVWIDGETWNDSDPTP